MQRRKVQVPVCLGITNLISTIFGSLDISQTFPPVRENINPRTLCFSPDL